MGQILLAPLSSLKKVNNGFRHHAIDSLGPLFSALNFHTQFSSVAYVTVELIQSKVVQLYVPFIHNGLHFLCVNFFRHV